ncbi:MAG: hypothetical protein WC989_01340 [Micavibrio sp.]
MTYNDRMAANWFSEAVAPKPQTPEYILQRMALTIAAPAHKDALRFSCHQLAAKEIIRLHNEDRLTSGHRIVMLGLGPIIYHTILTDGADRVVFDSLGGTDGNRYDPERERYLSGTFAGHIAVKHSLPVDDFFSGYLAKIIVPAPVSAAAGHGGPELLS